MSGFSYELEIEGNRFLGGDIDEPIQIDPVASSELQVPVEFGFREVLETITSLREADEAAYAVSFEFRFDVPVLGPVSVPVRAEGRVPIPRLPSIQLGALNLEGITIAGADLRLDLAIRNPNSFGLRIQSLAYEFAVDGNSWVDGSADRPQAVPAGQESVISLPFSIRFLSLGRTVRHVLLGRDALQYALDINAVIAADIGLIPSLDLPVQLSGSVDLSR